MKYRNKKIKKIFNNMDTELQEAIKFLINDMGVKNQIKKLEKSENSS